MSSFVPIKKSRRMLLLMFALFMAPLALAFWLYYGSEWRPRGTTNNGALIEPARALPTVALRRADGTPATTQLLRGKWSLVVIADGACTEQCQSNLHYARQTALGLGRLQSRVQPVWLVSSRCCDQQITQRVASDMLVLNSSSNSAAPLLSTFPTTDRERMIFVVDPLGFLMMRYDTRLEPKGLRMDLKHLLDLSQIG
jgi:hypothetical protein